MRRQTAIGVRAFGRGSTVVPGAKRTPDPAVTQAWETWKPRRGPATPCLGCGRQADREESWSPRREQDAQEANAGGRKATGIPTMDSLVLQLAVVGQPAGYQTWCLGVKAR